MFKVTKIAEDRLGIEMSGKLDSKAMEDALDELTHQVEGIENGKLLYDVVDFHLPTLSAIIVEFARLPSMLGLMKRFRKAAVLTDKAWLQTASEIEGALFPGLEIKAFKRDQRVDAEAWLGA